MLKNLPIQILDKYAKLRGIAGHAELGVPAKYPAPARYATRVARFQSTRSKWGWTRGDWRISVYRVDGFPSRLSSWQFLAVSKPLFVNQK